jgi:hypothetical protein
VPPVAQLDDRLLHALVAGFTIAGVFSTFDTVCRDTRRAAPRPRRSAS